MKARPELHPIPLTVVLFGIVLLTLPFHLRPDNFVVDDGYFYPQIARYIAHGQGSTFNGIMLTNGYHPLWMLVSAAVAKFTSSSGALLQILSAVQDLLLLGSVTLLVLMARAERLRGAVLGCAPLIFFGATLGIWRLLETNLSLALQLAILVMVVPVMPGIFVRSGWKRSVVLGVLFGLVMLARLDLLFFVFAVLLYQVLDTGREGGLAQRLAQTVLQSVCATALLVPYLLWNWQHFHHLVTISGAIKSTFPHVQHWIVQPFVYPVVAAIVWNGALLFRRVRSHFESICLITAAGAALHLGYTLSYGELSLWYLTTGYLTLSLAMIRVLDLALRRLPWPEQTERIVATLIFAAFFVLAGLRVFSNFTYTHLRLGRVRFNPSYVESKRALAMKLRETLPAGSRIMIFDAPGGVAFYSGMSLLPVDGLVSDFQYNRELVAQGVARYAAANHIDYFIGPLLKQGQTYDRLDLQEARSGSTQVTTVKAPLTHESGGSFSLEDSDLVFSFAEINPDLESTFPEIGVWRIRH